MGSICAGGEKPFDCLEFNAPFIGDLGGSSPGSRFSSVEKKSPVRCRSCDCSFACLSSV